MRRARERGHAAVWVLATLALSTGAGIAAYVAIKEHRDANPDPMKEPIREPEPREPISVAPPEPAPPPVIPEAPPRPVEDPIAEDGPKDPEPGEMFGTPSTDSGLPAESIEAALRPSVLRLRKCVDADSTNRGGVVRVTMVLNRRGGVTQVSGIDGAFGTCVEQVLKSVRFGRTTDGAKIVVAFSLQRPVADASCDEVACVLESYASPCCAKFKTTAPPPPPPPTTLGRQDLLAGITTVRPKIERCAKVMEFIGVAKVRFRVSPAGRVTEATVANAAPALESCVAEAFKTVTFPASENGATASFPFQIR